MSRVDFYRDLLPRLIRRLFTWGILSAVLVICCWYWLGGYEIWGRLIALFAFLKFDPATGLESAGLIYSFSTQGTSGDIVYKINSLSPNLVVLALLLGSWPFAKRSELFKVSLWCLLLILLFQVVCIWINLYYTSISPDFADRLHLFWEGGAWYSVMNRIYGFDKFILRYYGAFPVFTTALILGHFLRGKKKKKA